VNRYPPPKLRQSESKDIIAFDGKTLKRSYCSSDDKMSALHSVAVWSKDNGLVLAQARSKGKKMKTKPFWHSLNCSK